MLLLAALAGLVSGCAGGPAVPEAQTGTVTGHVILRTCGGAYRVDQNGCHVTPGSGVTLKFSQSSSFYSRSVKVDADGAYRIGLTSGTYSVSLTTPYGGSLSNSPAPMPHFSGPTGIVVSPGKTVTADYTETIELL